ncbi:pyridoxal-dependent decarboxylase [Synechococcus sp. BO 8801]|uniref:pyridoxal phosphate-dependent decarboxylase family protein n=1 Tax=Synechococcus sp. BO 8801 TaxID=169670 RepID=UPI00117CFC13|nr:pyridoxal-dependent decarboxylase [Synechococcus sp. BO 8801]
MASQSPPDEQFNDNPQHEVSPQFARTRAGFARFAASPNTPTLDSSGSRALEAWFLGPKAENAEELERLVVEAIRDQAFWRRNYFPGDPTHITESLKRSPDYLDAVGELRDGFRELLAFLKKSVPFFSMRYQGHMNWDLTLPGIAGYFAAMLYNPNNVAFEGSTATTVLEILVGDDLCRMLGYAVPTPDEVEAGKIRPWGHITCDGTVANIEALWAARNLKFYPLAFKAALAGASMAPARSIEIRTPSGAAARITDLSPWELLNLHSDDVLALPVRLEREFGITSRTTADALAPHSLQALGWLGFGQKFLRDVPDPVFTVPGSKHYSFPKAAAVLGYGAANMIDVALDLDARQDLNDLRLRLDGYLAEKRPVVAVVAVIGTTEESAVDPLSEIIKMRDEYAEKGLVFHVHADAAWGGYHRAVLNEDFDLPGPGDAFGIPPPAVMLNRHVEEQFGVLGHADSITVDPHKSGYIPYPAGTLCYRNASMRNLVTFSAPVVFHGEAEPTVGIYGIEGSKPGAAAASVYLSHRVIRPTRSGYGKIIGQALFSCRKLYARLLAMDEPQHGFKVVPVPRLPAERSSGSSDAISDQRRAIAELIDRRSSEAIRADADAMTLLREIGPDQNILSYAFNFYLPDGTLNTDLEAANRLNRALYGRLSIDPGDDIYAYPLVVSTTDFDVAAYGPTYIDDYKRRLGVGGSPGGIVTVLRSVIMDPWLTETSKGSFIDVLESEFRNAAVATIGELRHTFATGY